MKNGYSSMKIMLELRNIKYLYTLLFECSGKPLGFSFSAAQLCLCDGKCHTEVAKLHWLTSSIGPIGILKQL